ncbi:acyl transferase [Compostibacter hankyongensis]
MQINTDFEKRIFSLSNNADFEFLALELFFYQYRYNSCYRSYVDALRIDPRSIRHSAAIPRLPIGFFKTHRVYSGEGEPGLIFESSGTTGTVNSRHLVREPRLYEQSFLQAFERFYGPVSGYAVIGLLPSYLERQHSSLVYMVHKLIQYSGRPESGFYLYEHEKLHLRLLELEQQGRRTLLIGVTFALLDFAEKYRMQLQHTLVMETGGMKGRREELTRPAVHALLKERLGLEQVHSEYGMTELLSQAYAAQEGIFRCPPWMRVTLRDENDPLSSPPQEGAAQRGLINVIDLANIYSCAFLSTEDIGKLYPDGSFEVLGRMDNSALRGCSLMAV